MASHSNRRWASAATARGTPRRSTPPPQGPPPQQTGVPAARIPAAGGPGGSRLRAGTLHDIPAAPPPSASPSAEPRLPMVIIEQSQRHDEIDHHVRQELAVRPPRLLPVRRDRVIDRIAGRERSQHAERKPVRQPPSATTPLSAISCDHACSRAASYRCVRLCASSCENARATFFSQ